MVVSVRKSELTRVGLKLLCIAIPSEEMKTPMKYMMQICAELGHGFQSNSLPCLQLESPSKAVKAHQSIGFQ